MSQFNAPSIQLESNGASVAPGVLVQAGSQAFTKASQGLGYASVQVDLVFQLGGTHLGVGTLVELWARPTGAPGGSEPTDQDVILTFFHALDTSGPQSHRLVCPVVPAEATYFLYVRRGRLIASGWTLSIMGLHNAQPESLVAYKMPNGNRQIAVQGGPAVALSELAPGMVDVTATGTAHAGAGEYAGFICTVAAGNITVYDGTSAAGRVLVPTQALVLGPMPAMGPGTNTRLPVDNGLHVVFSNPAARVTALVG